MTSKAPRAFNREMYHDHPENVFYGTDDGSQDGSFREFAEFKAHYEGVAPTGARTFTWSAWSAACTASTSFRSGDPAG